MTREAYIALSVASLARSSLFVWIAWNHPLFWPAFIAYSVLNLVTGYLRPDPKKL